MLLGDPLSVQKQQMWAECFIIIFSATMKYLLGLLFLMCVGNVLSQQLQPLSWSKFYFGCHRDSVVIENLPECMENKIKWNSDATPEQKAVIRYILSNMIYVEGEENILLGDKGQYSVSLADFYIGRYEVNQDEWFVIMGDKPSNRLRRSFPVDQISWTRAIDFVNRLNELSGLSFNLPSEAQWEYAARGGKFSHDYLYSGSNNAKDVAWYKEKRTYDACVSELSGRKIPNELGIYDMSGNLYEWCLDYFTKPFDCNDYHPTEARLSEHKVLRGGSFYTPEKYCRVTSRYGVNPQRWDIDYGVRLVLNLN